MFASVIVRRLVVCMCVCTCVCSTCVSEIQNTKKKCRKAPNPRSTEPPLCLLMCLAKFFTIGLVARIGNRNNFEASAQKSIPSCEKTSVSTSLLENALICVTQRLNSWINFGTLNLNSKVVPLLLNLNLKSVLNNQSAFLW